MGGSDGEKESKDLKGINGAFLDKEGEIGKTDRRKITPCDRKSAVSTEGLVLNMSLLSSHGLSVFVLVSKPTGRSERKT